MPVPIVTCGADQIVLYDINTRLIALSANATNSPVGYVWNVLSVPLGSVANVGVKGDFTDGVAYIQNPDLLIDGDITGTYVIQCVAYNSQGPSNPGSDKEGGQQLIVVRTKNLQWWVPNDYSYDWGKSYLNLTLNAAELAMSLALPEILPIIDTVVGDTYVMRSPTGASTALRVTLSDGKSYTATSPLAMDITGTGLLAREASTALAVTTHYYNYAVPDVANPGEFSIIASDRDPSLGSADYPAWRYLGSFFRVDGGAIKIRKVHQVGNHFYYPDLDDTRAASLIIYDVQGADYAGAWYTWFTTSGGGAPAVIAGTTVLNPLGGIIPTKVAFSVDIQGALYASGVSANTGILVDSGEFAWAWGGNTKKMSKSLMYLVGAWQYRVGKQTVILYNEDISIAWPECQATGIGMTLIAAGYVDKYL